MWQVFFTQPAKRNFRKIDAVARAEITEKLEWLAGHFDAVIPLPLGGDWRGFFKFRIGDFRVIYKIDWDKRILIVYALGRRDKIYKKKGN
jgi:mRNA interferase RelE/StbE